MEKTRQSGTVPLWPDAGQRIGIGRSLAYELAARGEFPVPVIRAGHRYLVPLAKLEALLGEREAVPA